MNRIICIIILMLCMGSLSAQTNRFGVTEIHEDECFVLDSAFREARNYEYYATESIYLDRGFFRNADFPLPHLYDYSMLLTVDGLGVYHPGHGQQGGPNEGDTGYVGSIGGTVDVGAMGGATYTIPIELPAGINGVQPSLAFVYNSQGGNGLLGWKWELSGLSSITRTGRTRYHDGSVGGVTLNDQTDRFVLDGQRLIQVHDYIDSIDYKTEQDEMARIRAYTSNQGERIINNFRVWNPDGTILEYGFSEDSRIDPQNGGNKALCWLLNKVSDRNGNFFVYNYTELQNTGEFYIESIQYTFNEGLHISPGFSVKFDYCRNKYNQIAAKSDYEFGYVAGNIVQQKRLLKTITVENKEETELIKYTLSYCDGTTYAPQAYAGNVMYHRLKEIQLEKGGKAVNPTLINWEWDESPSYHGQCAYKVDLDTAYLNNFVFVGDFNADGFSDVITVPYKESNSHHYSSPIDMNVLINTGDGSFVYNPNLSMNHANGNPIAANLDWIHVIDINDDGYDDLIMQFFIWSPYTVTTPLKVLLNQAGNGFVPVENIQHDGCRYYLSLGDFLGDGKQSVLAFLYVPHNYPNGARPVLIPDYYIHYENGECVAERIYAGPMVTNELAVGDFDGDGKTEFLMVDTSDAKTYQLTRSEIGDLLFEEEQQCNTIKYVPELNLFPGDYNGDGKDDLLCYGESLYNPEDREWFFVFSTGTGFQREGTHLFEHFGFAPSEKMYTYSLERVTSQGFALFASDFDGDGLCDIALANGEESLKVYSKFLTISWQIHIPHYGLSDPQGGTHPMASSTVWNFNTRSQYLHVGNFYCKDNMSFLGNEAMSQNGAVCRKPVLCSIYSLHEYNSVTSIIDGLGNVQRLSYRYPAVHGLPKNSIGNGIVTMNAPLRTLSISTTYRTDAPVSTSYLFENAAIHKDGHDYLGFLNQTTLSSVNGNDVAKHYYTFETETMGCHALSLPKDESIKVYMGGEWRDAMKRDFLFRKATCSFEHTIVRPALTRQSTVFFNTDNPNGSNDCLRKEIVEYEYSLNSSNSYSQTYNCIETRIGTNAQNVENYEQCEFQTVETIKFLPDNYTNWVINRPHIKTVVQSRTGKPDVNHCWWFEYAHNSYKVTRVFDIPNLHRIIDPLTIQTDYEYYPEGNLKKQTVRAPEGELNEPTIMTEYEYGPENQRRLVVKKTICSGELSYETRYSYDIYDLVDTIIGNNGLVTRYESDALGIAAKAINPDGTQTASALRWVEDGDAYAPEGALYLKWERASGCDKTLTYYHKSGAELRSVSFGLNGEAFLIDKTYDTQGRLFKVSNPYMEGETPQWTSYQYDDLDRPTKTTTPDGTVSVITYLGAQTRTTIVPTQGEPQTTTITSNAMGWTVRSDDASGDSYVTYDHFADGLLATAMVNDDASTTITATYDNARNRITLSDPNYGTLTTTYNAYGELRKRVSPRELTTQQETVYLYDGMGRLVRETNGMENTTTHYIYDETEGALKGTLKQIHHRTLDNQTIQNIYYGYDELARLTRTAEQRPSCSYETLTTYDDLSRVSQTVYPTGVTVNYEYAHGYLQTILDADFNLLWKTEKTNAYGQLVDATLGNGSTTHRAYDPEMHYIDSIVTSNNLQNLSYDYDKFGNLASRKDNKRNMEETFHYDKMNRLTDIYNGTLHSQIVYDPLGRMTAKQADGLAVFANASFDAAPGQPAQPHAMKSAETVEGVFPAAQQQITYTAFDKVKSISEDGNGLIVTYGYDQQRIRSYLMTSDNRFLNKDYVGVCEYNTEYFVDGGAIQTTFTYLVGPYGVFAVVEKGNNSESIHYILKDHLGSWTSITDSEGNVEQEISFDAWGNLRDPETWLNYPTDETTLSLMFDRGFTGHEHMTTFGLINMNGRCYDPLTSSFLSVDAYVQDPTNAQGFNRYAYCSYNPLRYTDPTGWYKQTGANPNPNINLIGTTTYHSDDPCEMLWGRSVHPCSNSSSGYINGMPYTTTVYVQGNYTTGNWYKDMDGTIKYSSELKQASDLQEGQIFYGTCFVENDIYYSLVGSKYDINSVAGQIVRKLEDGVWPNYTRYMEEIDEYLHSPYDPSNPNQCEPSQKSTDFNGILEYDNKGRNCITFKYGDAQLYFFIHKEPNAMYGRFEGWDSPTGFSRNSSKTGNHLPGGYDAHVLAWGKDPIRNAPKTGQYQQDVILLVYPSHESRENASRLVYEKYRKKH